MKKLLLPLLIGVLGGVGAASAATIMTAKKSAAAYALFVTDSVAKHVKDSTAAADSVEKELKAREAEEAAAEALMTPADSIRAAQSLATTLKLATRNVPNAIDPKHAAPAEAKHGAVDTHAPATPTGHVAAPPANVKTGAALPGKAATPPVVVPRTTAAKVPEVVENGLPENRIAKIFGAMPSKDAAKVLEQMSDSDIRVILGKMGDKQAAAILIAFPASRAAAISKGAAVKPEAHKNDASKADSSKIKKDSSGEHK